MPTPALNASRVPPRLCLQPPRRLRAVLAVAAAAAGCGSPGGYAVTAYGGQYVDSALAEEILVSQPLDWQDGYLAAVAVSHAFHRPDDTHQWEVEGQLGKYWGGQENWELNALVALRWLKFPWNQTVRTTMALGEGLSWATEIPELEEELGQDEHTSQLLNYLLLELTWAAPSWKHWSFVTRLHHRSGVFGLFDDVVGGSNVLTVGVRYDF